MIQLPWRETPLTDEQAADLFWFCFEDDTEDAPWMVMGDLQFWSASGLAHSLRSYARARKLDWYVASMLPINFRPTPTSGRHTVAPDLFVARVPEHPRASYDLDVEGQFPEFVLEVVSPSSVDRDQNTKRTAYEALELREYALFTPRAAGRSTLQGFQLNDAKKFEPWALDSERRLWSSVLGLFLVARGAELRAQTPNGRLLLTLEEAEAENERLRQELDQRHDERT